MIGSNAPITVLNDHQVNGNQTIQRSHINAGAEGGENPFSNIYSQQLGLFRLGQMSALQNMMSISPLGVGGQGFANFGQFLPGMNGFNSPLPVTIINYNFFSLSPTSDSSEQEDLAQLLESVDLSQLAEESIVDTVTGLGSESQELASLPAAQTSSIEIPKTPEELGEKLAERLAALARGGDTEIKATINHNAYGPIGIEVSIQDNRITLNLSTEDAGLHAALEAATESLSKNIASQGLALAGFTVSGLNSIDDSGGSTSNSGQAVASLYNSINAASSPLGLINSIS